MDRALNVCMIVLAVGLFPAEPVTGESYLGSDAAGRITKPHPAGKFLWPIVPVFNAGLARWEVNIPYRLDPAFTPPEQAAIISAFDTWNARAAVAVNLGAVAGGIDLESLMLHEIGHAIGLGHPNYESGGIGGPPPLFMFTGGLHSRCAQRELSNIGLIDFAFAFIGNEQADCGLGPDGLFGTADDTPAAPFPVFGADVLRYYDDAANNPWAVCGVAPGPAIPIP